MYRQFSILIVLVFLIFGSLNVQPTDSSLPHLVNENGHHKLIADGRPFLTHGTQRNKLQCLTGNPTKRMVGYGSTPLMTALKTNNYNI